jgi:hypothetical protein
MSFQPFLLEVSEKYQLFYRKKMEGYVDGALIKSPLPTFDVLAICEQLSYLIQEVQIYTEFSEGDINYGLYAFM